MIEQGKGGKRVFRIYYKNTSPGSVGVYFDPGIDYTVPNVMCKCFIIVLMF